MNKTTVIVLHYRGVGDTICCLQSVLPQRHAELDVLLVDNGSDDGLTAILQDQGLDVTTLRLAENRGWAGGNNAGVAWAREHGADVVCLLNNDTLVPLGTFDHLSGVAREVSRCLLHPAIDFADPSEGVQLDPTQWAAVEPIPGHARIYKMHYAYGACLMIPVAVFDQIGLFDERFFLQLEETDFYQRCQRENIPTLCDTSVRILHIESRAFGARATPDKSYYIARNSLLLATKNLGSITLVSSILKRAYWNAATAAGIGDKPSLIQVLIWLASSDDHARAIREGVRDFAFRRFGRRRNG